MKKLLLTIFFLSFLVEARGQLIRGPYLQAVTSNSIVIRWRTSSKADSQVKYGTQNAALNQLVAVKDSVTEHEIKITGLLPKTRYYYAIGSKDTELQSGGMNYFETTPLPGERGHYRFGVLGDCGTNSAVQGNVRDQLSNYLGTNYMNAWLLLGDNAYSFGTDAEYQSNFFNHYKDDFLKRYPLFPSPGNHDYHNDNSDRQNDHKIPYYDIFTMPSQGESGGTPSGTEAFYSFDYGNVHFLSLDSYGREDQSTRLYDTLGRQVQWIKADLAASRNKEWIVAYWHHPPFSLGSRNSETDPEMTKIRENFIRILERYGVDLIICGHSHVYERTRLIKGFYQKATSFNAAVHNVSQSSGRYDGSDNSCTYVKSSENNAGTVYVVSGSAGHLGARASGWPHKAMYYADNERGGSVFLEVEGNRLDMKWIGQDGQIRDKFTMQKNVNKEQNLTIEKGASIRLDASFKGQYVWSNGASTSSLTVSPTSTADYSVRDVYNCIQDVFHITVSDPLPVKLFSFQASISAANIVKLDWVTEMEHNFSHFEIQRSRDAKTFTEAGRVNGVGNSSDKKSYSFTETPPNEDNAGDSVYYRLKMVDSDNTFEYSRIVAIKLNEIILGAEPVSDDMDIEILPNPSRPEEVRVRLVRGGRQEADVMIVDVNGRIVTAGKMQLSAVPTAFAPQNLNSGIYFLKTTIKGKVISKKFVVL